MLYMQKLNMQKQLSKSSSYAVGGLRYNAHKKSGEKFIWTHMHLFIQQIGRVEYFSFNMINH